MLESEPDMAAKNIFLALQAKYPQKFPDGQLRTLQRRVREWRRDMAKKLVFVDNWEDHGLSPDDQYLCRDGIDQTCLAEVHP